MMLESFCRVETQTEKHLHTELLRDIKRVAGKVQILCGRQYCSWYQYVIRAEVHPPLSSHAAPGLGQLGAPGGGEGDAGLFVALAYPLTWPSCQRSSRPVAGKPHRHPLHDGIARERGDRRGARPEQKALLFPHGFGPFVVSVGEGFVGHE
jgi:hypothetical protein